MAHTLTVECRKPGGVRAVDAGRPGYRSLGVVSGGAADIRAASVANELLAQAAEHPTLEFTLFGGSWLLSGEGQMVITGADMDWQLDGEPLERYRVIYLKGKHMLSGGAAKRGCRSYLAIHGEWQLPRILGSVEAGLPGARNWQTGTEFSVIAQGECPFTSRLNVDVHLPVLPLAIAVTPGPEFRWLTAGQSAWLTKTTFRVGRDSNRQGIRLITDDLLPGPTLPSLISSPVLPGTVQLTPGGPIILGVDAQTVGGYPRVLLVEGDLGELGQLRPGDCVAMGCIAMG